MTLSLGPVLVTAAGVLGLLVGSFLNVVIHRVPVGASIVRPGSACPSCDRPIRARDNIPVGSWLLLRGRCRDCSVAIPGRYPVVEAVTALLFAGVTAAVGPAAVLPALLVTAAAGVALFVIDLDHHRLPDAIVLPSYGVLALLLVGTDVLGADVPQVRVLTSAGVWLAVYGLVWLLSAGRGMGLGDVKLAGILGLVLGWLGWGPSLVGLLSGFVIGGVVGGALLATGRVGRRTRIAHGPFMLLGTALAVFAGAQLWSAYLSVTGLG